jgi:Ethanolamine utilization protein EutJ (predicted chaperonin)
LLAGRDHPFIDGHVLLDLGHRLFRRQQLKEPFQQHVLRAVDECAASIAHRIQSHHVQGVDDAAGASFQIGVEPVFLRAFAEQQFVPQHFLIFA